MNNINKYEEKVKKSERPSYKAGISDGIFNNHNFTNDIPYEYIKESDIRNSKYYPIKTNNK